jgi:ribosomal protein S18 acetylase RimI-like enzyme
MNMAISYKTGIDNLDWDQLTALYHYPGIGMVGGRGEKGDKEGIRQAFLNSYRVVTAWNDNRLVGSCRILSDGLCYGMIFDVGVLPEHRRKGVATTMLNLLLDGMDNMTIHLTSRFGMEDLYRKLGFKRHKNAFARYSFPTLYVEEG